MHLVATELCDHLKNKHHQVVCLDLDNNEARLEESCQVKVPMNRHIKLKSFEQFGEILNVNVRPDPLFLDIILVCVYVDEKS